MLFTSTYGPENSTTTEKKLRYIYHPYHSTWANERRIEIPIFLDAIKEAKNKRILEVGNTLQHYTKINHEVLDKYEIYPDVINQDIVDFKPKKKYDLIISISTLEHVGVNGGPGEKESAPGKSRRAIENITNLLKPGGKLLFSYPEGYSPDLDKTVTNIKNRKDKVMIVYSKGLRFPRRKFRIHFVEIYKN